MKRKDTKMIQSIWSVLLYIFHLKKHNVIKVRAHLGYSMHPNKVYAITNGEADSCILGILAEVISHTGRCANLIGFDPTTVRKDKVPIVSAYIKAQSSSLGQLPVLLKVHKGLVNDSVAKKHQSAHGNQG